MGFDVSYHPVDRAVFVDRLIPYIRGEGSIDDLLESAVRIAKVRYRAHCWALELLKVSESGTLANFHGDLHVWGRPFLITVPDALEASKAVDEYLAADEAGVDAIAARMVETLEPGLADKARPADDDFLSVKAKRDLHEETRKPLDRLREIYKAFKEGRNVTVEGEKMPAEEALAESALLTLVAFYSRLQPGWMGRGHVWPTQLLASIGVRFKLFETPAHLIQPLVDEIPSVGQDLQNTIVENYMVGGYVRAENVSAWREGLQWAIPRILAAANQQGEAQSCLVVLEKLFEAVIDAERRGYGFAEATEVFSGPLGLVN